MSQATLFDVPKPDSPGLDGQIGLEDAATLLEKCGVEVTIL